MPLGLDNVIVMSDEARKRAFETAHSGGGGGVNSKEEGVISTAEGKPEGKKERKWRFGEQEFEALMRSLDNAVRFTCSNFIISSSLKAAIGWHDDGNMCTTDLLQGYRTGYIYRQPLIRNDMPRPKYDVELPPAVSSLGYLIEEEELYKNKYVFILPFNTNEIMSKYI